MLLTFWWLVSEAHPCNEYTVLMPIFIGPICGNVLIVLQWLYYWPDLCDLFTHILKVALLALGQSYDCPNASKATMKDMGTSTCNKPQLDTTKHKWSWWRHQMETFSTLLAFYVGNSLATGEFPVQRLVTRSFDVFFDLSLNLQLSKQWRRRWFEMPSRSLRCHCNVHIIPGVYSSQ